MPVNGIFQLAKDAVNHRKMIFRMISGIMRS
jgi:hypothetical protein